MHRFIQILFFLLLFVSLPVQSQKREKRSVVRLETNMGNIRIALSDQTPKYRDNFLKLVGRGFYDGIIFHRVIENFMIQAGDPLVRKNAICDTFDVNYTIPAEIVFPDLYHSRGSVAAAREPDDVNPDYESSASQFYIVWGEKMTPGKMKRSVSYLKGRGIELDRFMIDEYQVCGGSPHLDGAYTVFGEVIEGLAIVGEIQALPTDSKDRPLDDILIIRAVVEQLSENVSSLENK
ncbi:MAG: peptidylprolyl isomerase [Bacteroidaceae bacterium]|nr:peptidylprolyl isomerase [Bacteroidaceae bacterium]